MLSGEEWDGSERASREIGDVLEEESMADCDKGLDGTRSHEDRILIWLAHTHHSPVSCSSAMRQELPHPISTFYETIHVCVGQYNVVDIG